MTWVVDASVALKWFVEEDGSEKALRLLRGEQPVVAPELVVAEVCNAAWRLLRVGYLGSDHFEAIVEEVAGMFDRLDPLVPLSSRAAIIAKTIDHPVYDCFYLAQSERMRARFVTADNRLVERLENTEWSTLAVELKEAVV